MVWECILRVQGLQGSSVIEFVGFLGFIGLINALEIKIKLIAVSNSTNHQKLMAYSSLLTMFQPG